MGEPAGEFYSGEGCNFCDHTGYSGRTGVFEVMVLTDTTRKLVMQEASAGEIKAQAESEGMITMRRDGLLKVKQGVTTIAEVMRNVYTVS
jgi:type II secretory ATPase GspE/PulE/Tfp pilus assembly ATPase PilB-like protein